MDIENMNIEKATERCKALTNLEQGCWIGISNQKAIETVLSELENKQDDINILQAQRDSMEYQFKQAKAELEKKDKIIDLMAKWISNICFYKDDYGNSCEIIQDSCYKDSDCKQCIEQYFENKAEESK